MKMIPFGENTFGSDKTVTFALLEFGFLIFRKTEERSQTGSSISQNVGVLVFEASKSLTSRVRGCLNR